MVCEKLKEIEPRIFDRGFNNYLLAVQADFVTAVDFWGFAFTACAICDINCNLAEKRQELDKPPRSKVVRVGP
jgi:hypothetical protein